MTIKYIILDVDGTLTDGGIYYDETGNEVKKFCTKDGTGIVAAKAAGIRIIVLTGRECRATTRRLSELGINSIYQGVKDKVAWLRDWIKNNEIDKAEICYIGDDVNDIAPMKLCGYIGCPADAAKEVKEVADYISPVFGGHGAVRDVIEHILKDEDKWNEVIDMAYGCSGI